MTSLVSTARIVVMAFLALWSIVSLVVIVVWATSPDLKGSAQCRAELRDATEKLEGAKVVWNKKKEELVELVEAGRQEREHQRAEILLLLGRLNATNATLEAYASKLLLLLLCLFSENVVALQQNLTQAIHQNASCFSLKAAAESLMLAAQSQTRACQSKQLFLEKQLKHYPEVQHEFGSRLFTNNQYRLCREHFIGAEVFQHVSEP
uniref:Uncharacterized protein n=1 Tax=Mola mola TaxID=94237 RepID=A0A3Q3W6T8_MOLML